MSPPLNPGYACYEPPNIAGEAIVTDTKALGRLVAVPVREVWVHEAHGFTPWLAQTANMSLLADALGLSEIEVEATERTVGRFSADIVAREEGGNWVLVENQLEATDHRHLGQIITYLAGLEGEATIVWIATNFLEEHRAAIDWLNSNTSDRFDFFGVEIEVLRIGTSEPAPRFNVVAKPNDWSRGVRSAARQAGETVLAERHHTRLAYWASFAEYLKEKNSTFHIRRPNKDHWFSFGIGNSAFHINATISTEKERVGVELYAPKDAEKTAFNALYAQKEAVEREFGEPLEWQELPGRKATRIAVYKHGVDPSDQERLAELHAWMLAKMDRFRAVFAMRIRSLSVSSVAAVDEADEGPEE
jgi:Domain of unknown function (DUF4268)